MTKPELVSILQDALDAGDAARAQEALEAADPKVAVAALTLVLADAPPGTSSRMLEHCPPSIVGSVLTHLEPALAADILAELDDTNRAPLLASMSPAVVSRIVDEMPSDDATDLVQDLSPEHAGEVVSRLDDEMRTAVEELVRYDEATAGGLMEKEFATVPADFTAAQAIARLRTVADDIEDMNVLYAVDEMGRLVGTFSLRDLLMASADEHLTELISRHRHWVNAHEDQEDVAQYMLDHDLDAVPVVDDARRVIGQITLDDAAEVVAQEATEDMHRVAGVLGTERVFSPLGGSVARRLPWLLLNVPLAGLASAMVHIFGHAVERVPAVVAFLPLVGGIAGNAAGQTVSVFVRGLATKEAGHADLGRCLVRQTTIGVIMGICLGALIGGMEFAWGAAPVLALIGGLALLANCMTACFMGALLTFGLKRFGIDPAMGANLVDTAITDAAGYFYVLGLTTLALGWHLL